MIWLYAYLTLLLVVFITSYSRNKFSWSKTKVHWLTNKKASVVSLAVNISLTAIVVLTSGFSVPTIIAIVGLTSVGTELAFNRSN